VKDLTVKGGPIAPWFGQPGLGAQFYIGETGNILKLIELGYLARVHKSDVEPGPGNGRGCGW
jgi:Tuberculosis necrotizing toxin